jgi:hypothetical protein
VSLPPLDYEPPRNRIKPRWTWPPDWRRRLIVALIAAPIVFVLTFEAARRNQSSLIAYSEGGSVNIYIQQLQTAVDQYWRTTGHLPVNLTDVPAIAQRSAKDPAYLTDPWQRPYMLQTINGKPTIISYARDKRPAGRGLDADITIHSLYGSDPPTFMQFIQVTHLTPVIIICLASALATAAVCFVGSTDTRVRRGGMFLLLIPLIITALITIFIGGVMAVLHSPRVSGH